VRSLLEENIMAENDDLKTAPSPDTCPGKIEVPTEEERVILAQMKSIKEQVRELKKRLNTLTPSGGDEDADETPALKKELARLKVEWEEWDRKRRRAAKERMILLGHEKRT
jgi:hypothetical protein